VILTTVTAGSAAGPADPRLVAHTRIREIRKGRRNVFSPLFTILSRIASGPGGVAGCQPEMYETCPGCADAQFAANLKESISD
jgi:hypothetical protein